MPFAIRPSAALAALLLAGAVPLPLSAQEGGTVRAVMHSALRMLDPIASSGTITRNHGYMIFDTLLGVDESLSPRPQMADWEVSEDGLTYSFTLREGLVWHDGAPVTADDCVASLQRWASLDAGGRILMAYVEAIEPQDDRRFTIRLSEPFGTVPDLLAKPSSLPAFMMPKRLAETASGDTIAEQVGSGPFRFVEAEFQPGVQVVYERFDDYVPRDEPPSGTAGGKVVHVDRVEWIAMPDAQTALNALMAGDIDYIERAPIDLLPILEAQEDITTAVLEPLGMQVAGRMNFLHPPFDDAAIRRAALLALGQQDVLAALIGDERYYEVCGAVFGCGTPFASETGAETLTAGGDAEAARAGLEAAGYDGTPVVMLQPTDVATLSAQPVVAADALRRAGFEVRLEPMDWQTLVSRRASQAAPAQGGWNMFFTNANVDSLSSPVINMYLTATGTEGSWFGWPTDPDLEALRIDFATAGDDEARKAAAEAVQAHVLEEAIVVPLGQFHNVTAWGPSLNGLIEGPVPAFWNLTKSE